MSSVTLTTTPQNWTSDKDRVGRNFHSALRTFTKALRSPVNSWQDWEETGASVAHVSATDIELLEQLYLFRKPKEVRKFLQNKPLLLQVLVEAYLQAQVYFPDSEVVLQIVSDPEENSHKLFAYIITEEPVEVALARLDQLDNEWFLEQPYSTRRYFNFNLRFV